MLPSLKIFLGLFGMIIIFFSFLFDNGEDDFSPSWESKENINKGTHFTKLTNLLRNIYMLLLVVFIMFVF